MIERVVTAGTFSLDGQDFAVENNVYLVGDDAAVLAIDAAHDAAPILERLGGRRLVAIVATHGHNDHINAAVPLAQATGAPILIHADDAMLWEVVAPSRRPDGALVDKAVLEAGGVRLEVLHTPGHTPGGCCLYDAAAGVLFSGDTLFRGGPGATGRRYSDFATIVAAIRDRLLVLAPETRVLPGHGEETTIGDEAPHLAEWLARGY